jgi:hypothetical protein
MGEYANQHYIPRSYLKHFAFEGKVMLRRRGAEPHLAPVNGVAKASSPGTAAQPGLAIDRRAENAIGRSDVAGARRRRILGHQGSSGNKPCCIAKRLAAARFDAPIFE